MIIVKFPDSRLRIRCHEVVFPDYVICSIVDNMITAAKSCNVAGIAANQVGYMRRIVIMKDGDNYIPMINPLIMANNNYIIFSREECLSIPGTTVTIPRYNSVSIQYNNLDGSIERSTFTGLKAVVIQHEIDHLNGKLMIDRLDGKLTDYE